MTKHSALAEGLLILDQYEADNTLGLGHCAVWSNPGEFIEEDDEKRLADLGWKMATASYIWVYQL